MKRLAQKLGMRSRSAAAKQIASLIEPVVQNKQDCPEDSNLGKPMWKRESLELRGSDALPVNHSVESPRGEGLGCPCERDSRGALRVRSRLIATHFNVDLPLILTEGRN